MECQTSDSKKLLKVFEASKRRKGRKKRDGLDETNSIGTDDSNSINQAKERTIKSAKASLQDVTPGQGDGPPGSHSPKRDRDSSPSVSASPAVQAHRSQRSPRRHRRPQREGISLALKAGLVSTPRSISPQQDGDGLIEGLPRDQDSFIYTFLEDAIKRDKRKHRHSRRRDEQCCSRDRNRDRTRDRERDRDQDRTRDHDFETNIREHRHHRHRREEIPSRDHEPAKEVPAQSTINQALLFETFAKLCTTITEQKAAPTPAINEVIRSQSHKSLQCEVVTPHAYDVDQRPVRLRSREPSHHMMAASRTRVRSHENLSDSRQRLYSPQRIPEERKDKYYPPLEKKYSKLQAQCSRTRHEDDRYREYAAAYPARSCTDHFRDRRDYRGEYEERRDTRDRRYDEDKRRCCEQKTTRSFDVHREAYDEERFRRTTRSESHNPKKRMELRDARYDDRHERRYDERREKYADEKDRELRDRHYSNLPSKDRRSKRNLERFERISVASRDEEYRERDRFSERERDSGLSVADGETSTISGKSNYLRVVKQEIAEQRESMDKMMKLWKELMRCFKGLSQNQGQEKAVHEAANVQESAAAQLRLWRECMRRYETVARDVGDTDARLMEEITKQRNEMAEMATMWQECLQRYRDMSNDFNNLKRQGGMGRYMGSPLRGRASAPPPAWWWGGEQPPPRRRSSPESRASRSRERRHRRKDREEPRYKEKSSSKATTGRSDHRHRKR